MRKPFLAISILLLCAGCGSKQSKNIESEIDVDEAAPEKMVLSAVAQDLLRSVEGEYFILSGEGSEIFFQENCKYNQIDVQVVERSGDWEIVWLGESFGITEAQDDNGNIGIVTSDEVEHFFTFYANENEFLWNLGSTGRGETAPIVKVEDIKNFKIKPCTDASEIMKSMPTSWFELTEMDEKQVIYIECESAPGGYDIGELGESVDFRSGSEPDVIISMSKSNNVVTIKHRSAFDESQQPRTLRVEFGRNENYAKFQGVEHVSVEIEDYFDTVEEDCE